MPLEPRSPDEFTRDNLLLGFSKVTFEPLLPSGLFGTPVELGILSGQELAKEINLIELVDSSPGTQVVVREIVSRFKPTWNLQTFNFRADVAQLIFGAQTITAQVANPAQSVVDEPGNVPEGAAAERTFVALNNADIDETTFVGTSVTCAPITDENVGTGNGTTGSTSGDFSLAYKPLIVADVTSVTVDGVAYTPVATGAAVAGNEVEVEVGATAVSGDLQFFQGGVAVNVTGPILASYAPSHAFANLTDYVVDPLLGRIRYLNVDGATDALKGGQPMLIDYSYNRKAGFQLQPFTQGGLAFLGRATVKQIPDVGANFVWNIPSVTIRVDDQSLTFGSDDLVSGGLALTVNDSGGSARYGTMLLSSESQSAA